MGAALFIVLDKKIPGLDVMMDGKSLSRASDALDSLSKRLKVKPLSDFVSAEPSQIKEFLENEGIDASELPIPMIQQFPAELGLDTIRALLHHIITNPDSVPESSGVIKDLQDCERILSVAAAHGVKWHMEVDF